MIDRRQRHIRKGESAEIHPYKLMATWIYVEKFLMGIQFLSETLSFMVVEDDDLEHPTQEQEERRMMMIDFELSRGSRTQQPRFKRRSGN
jgi:hypothetical protein